MRHSLVGLLVLVFGCDVAAESSDPLATGGAEINLRELLPQDALLVGVAVTPDGKRYVLDRRSGLYEVSEKSAALVYNTTGLNGIELTDVVALDNGRFAVTAENDGFLLDLQNNSFSSYFCYLPLLPETPATEPMSVSQTLQLEGIAVKQRTESVAFNPDSLQLFAQPQTIRIDTGSVAGSELFVFGQDGGEPIQVLPFADPSFVAAGMVAAAGDRLILGARNAIYELSLGGEFRLLRELESSVDITGMARAPNGELWVLDGNARRLLKVQGSL